MTTLATRQRGERRPSRATIPSQDIARDARRDPGTITLPTLAIYDGAPVTYAGGRLMVDGAVVRVREER